MSPLTEAREHVTTILGDLDYTVHPAPPEKISPPSTWVTPREPWAENVTLGATRVNLTVYIAVAMTAGNKAALANLEDRVWAARAALIANNVQVGPLSAPDPSTDQNTNVAVATLEVTVHVTDS
jgi:hypothetical protein